MRKADHGACPAVPYTRAPAIANFLPSPSPSPLLCRLKLVGTPRCTIVVPAPLVSSTNESLDARIVLLGKELRQHWRGIAINRDKVLRGLEDMV